VVAADVLPHGHVLAGGGDEPGGMETTGGVEERLSCAEPIGEVDQGPRINLEPWRKSWKVVGQVVDRGRPADPTGRAAQERALGERAGVRAEVDVDLIRLHQVALD